MAKWRQRVTHYNLPDLKKGEKLLYVNRTDGKPARPREKTERNVPYDSAAVTHFSLNRNGSYRILCTLDRYTGFKSQQSAYVSCVTCRKCLQIIRKTRKLFWGGLGILPPEVTDDCAIEDDREEREKIRTCKEILSTGRGKEIRGVIGISRSQGSRESWGGSGCVGSLDRSQSAWGEEDGSLGCKG